MLHCQPGVDTDEQLGHAIRHTVVTCVHASGGMAWCIVFGDDPSHDPGGCRKLAALRGFADARVEGASAPKLGRVPHVAVYAWMIRVHSLLGALVALLTFGQEACQEQNLPISLYPQNLLWKHQDQNQV